MLHFCADENFNNNILRGLLRQKPDLDIVRIQDAGLSGADDPTVLAWSATEKRIILTHDIRTMAHFAFERVERGQSMPGVFEIGWDAPVGLVIEQLLLLDECSLENEWGNQVICLPLKD